MSCSSFVFLLLLSLSFFSFLVAFSCGLRFVVCYLFLFSMRSLLFALLIMSSTHTHTPTNSAAFRGMCSCKEKCIHSYIYMRPARVCSAICVLSICPRLSLLPFYSHFHFHFHFSLSPLVLLFVILLLVVIVSFIPLRLACSQINWNISKMSACNHTYPTSEQHRSKSERFNCKKGEQIWRNKVRYSSVFLIPIF